MMRALIDILFVLTMTVSERRLSLFLSPISNLKRSENSFNLTEKSRQLGDVQSSCQKVQIRPFYQFHPESRMQDAKRRIQNPYILNLPEREHSSAALFWWRGPTRRGATRSLDPKTRRCLPPGHSCLWPYRQHHGKSVFLTLNIYFH